MMNGEEHEQRSAELARFAESEGATYYDPDSPTIWKRYIIGPVPWWRQMLWAIFPPSHAKMRRIQQRQSDLVWREATSTITGRDVGRAMSLSLAAPVILSALGPFYFGYTHSAYSRVIVWALACTVATLWLARASFRRTWNSAPPSTIGRVLMVVVIVAMIAVAFVVGDSIAYALARAISR